MILGQYNASEDRGNKLKQLLVKAKKDLADAKKLEGEQRSGEAQLKGQMELLNQQVKVMPKVKCHFNNLFIYFDDNICNFSLLG